MIRSARSFVLGRSASIAGMAIALSGCWFGGRPPDGPRQDHVEERREEHPDEHPEDPDEHHGEHRESRVAKAHIGAAWGACAPAAELDEKDAQGY